MKISCCLFFLLFVSLQLHAQSDSLRFRKNFVWVNPIVFSSDVAELNDYWLVGGYDRKLNDHLLIGMAAGTVVASIESKGKINSSGLHAVKTTGLRINLEGKYLFTKRFYASLNLFYQYGKTSCLESTADGNNTYFVHRSAYSLLPKFGCLLNKNGSHFYWDLSIGCGAKYISSATSGKINPLNNETEAYSGKRFETGSAWTYHPALHIKLGYNF